MLDELRSNIVELIALYEAERRKSEDLAEKLSGALAKSRKYEEQIKDLNQQIDNLKLANVLTGDAGKDVARERINKMIREIDKCIKLLEG